MFQVKFSTCSLLSVFRMFTILRSLSTILLSFSPPFPILPSSLPAIQMNPQVSNIHQHVSTTTTKWLTWFFKSKTFMNMFPQNQHLDLISSLTLSFLGNKPCPLLLFLKFKWFLKFQTFMNMFPQNSNLALVADCDSNESSSLKHSSTCFHKNNKMTEIILQV